MIKRGELWLVNLDPTIGQEIKKTRPAVVVSSNSIGKLPLKIIVPITDWKLAYAGYPWMICLEPDERTALQRNPRPIRSRSAPSIKPAWSRSWGSFPSR